MILTFKLYQQKQKNKDELDWFQEVSCICKNINISDVGKRKMKWKK